MDGELTSGLLTKLLWSAAVVIALSYIAERVSTTVAGILSGAPLGTVLVFLFVGLDLGTNHVLAGMPHAVSAFTGTCAFVVVYCLVAPRLQRGSVAGATLVSVAAFFAVSVLLSAVNFSILTALPLTVAACLLSYRALRSIAPAEIVRPIRLTPRVLVLRALLAGIFVVMSVLLAKALGPRWTGLMTGFPMTLLPTTLIIHSGYGAPTALALLRNVPLAMGSIVVYILAAAWSFPRFGVAGGTLAALVVALGYLAVLMHVQWRRAGRIRSP